MAPVSLEEGIDGECVDELEGLGSFHGPLELGPGQDDGEVEQGARDGGDGNAVDFGYLVGP